VASPLDIFLVSNDGGLYTAAWEADVAGGAWRGWWRIGTAQAPPGSMVGVAERRLSCPRSLSLTALLGYDEIKGG
jgi:hypothetical protein